MALKLVDEMTEKWQPEAFKDTYRDDLMKRIEQKVKSGQTHALTQPEAEVTEQRAAGGGKVVDLMSLLQAQPRAERRRRRQRRRRRARQQAQTQRGAPAHHQ